MRINKFIIAGFILSFLLCLYAVRYYYVDKNRQLEEHILILSSPFHGYESWKETIGILLEALKKQHIRIDDAKELFSFYGIEHLYEISDSAFLWQAFDYDKIDMEYDKSYDKIMELSLEVFLLFKDSVLIDYRHYGNRELLHKYLRNEVEPYQ